MARPSSRRAGIRGHPLSLSLIVRQYLVRSALRDIARAQGHLAVASDHSRAHLAAVVTAFLDGYEAAVFAPHAVATGTRLFSTTPDEHEGFAYEGASMALALFDGLRPRSHGYISTLLRGPGGRHTYMVHVGVGWAMARLPHLLAQRITPIDPLLRWLSFDGMGFHDGYLVYSAHRGLVLPRHQLHGYQRRAFDQGLGRAIWFLSGGQPGRAVGLVNSAVPARRPDLWSGLGLAVAYAGGTDRTGLELLRVESGLHLPPFGQGIAFAAAARQRAENMVPHTELACAILGMTANGAAALTRSSLVDLPSDAAEPGYEIWRKRIQQRFASGANIRG